MIVVTYVEHQKNPSTGAGMLTRLGSESHDGIDEVLLPCDPIRNEAVYFTKKFVGHPEYRWQVISVLCESDINPTTYVVTLFRRNQIPRDFYLKNIVAAKKCTIRSILYPWSLVEVEFGRSFSVGRLSGDVRGTKRYVDTTQRYSMPKQRSAVVNQVIQRHTEDLVQVIPISSQEPSGWDSLAAVEVTSQLGKLPNYQKQSWAVCRMIQTVTASRVIAPIIQLSALHQTRDKGFRSMIRGRVREQIKNALMHGVAAASQLTDSTLLAREQQLTRTLNVTVEELSKQSSESASKVKMYERFVLDSGLSLTDVSDMYALSDSE